MNRPEPTSGGPYGLQRVEAGVYLHHSGRYVIRTGGWEGPKGGNFSLWEIADWEDGGDGSGFTVEAYGGARTLREKAVELDADRHA